MTDQQRDIVRALNAERKRIKEALQQIGYDPYIIRLQPTSDKNLPHLFIEANSCVKPMADDEVK